MGFDHKSIEKKWQTYWEENKTFRKWMCGIFLSRSIMFWICFRIRAVMVCM